MNTDQYFQSGIEVINKLNKHGHEAYIVGGAVRDFVMGRSLHDIDIATSASVEQICSIFPKTIKVAIHHGTVIVRHNEMSFEVTAFRGETLYEDLAKRDFTMNAMAMTSLGIIIDPFQGQVAIANQNICTVGNSIDRFQEDPLRMLRLFRFSSELGFTISRELIQLVRNERERISEIAIERMMNELEKLFKGSYINFALQLLFETRLLEMRRDLRPFDVLQAFLVEGVVIANVPSLTEIWVLVLYKKNIENIDLVLRSCKQSKKVMTEVAVMIKALPTVLSEGWTRSVLYRLGKEMAYRIEWVKSIISGTDFCIEEIDCLYETLPIKSKKDLMINGRQMAKLLGKTKEGKKIGQLLTQIESAVVDGVVDNQTTALIDWLRKEELLNEE